MTLQKIEIFTKNHYLKNRSSFNSKGDYREQKYS